VPVSAEESASPATSLDGTAAGFGGYEDFELPTVPAAASDDKLSWERELLGMYLSDHPLRRVDAELRSRVDTAIGELGPHLDGLVVQVGGTVREVRAVVPRRSTSGQRMAFVQLEDMSGTCEVVVFARTFEEAAAVLQPDAIVVVRGKVESQRAVDLEAGPDDEIIEGPAAKIIAESVYALEDPRLLAWRANQTLHITLPAAQARRVMALKEAFDEHPGDTPVVVHVEHAGKVDEVSLPASASVTPSPGLERAVLRLLGDNGYRVEIRRDRAGQREVRRGAMPQGVSATAGAARRA
jgi:DNA polymerase-3 subunit alpha